MLKGERENGTDCKGDANHKRRWNPSRANGGAGGARMRRPPWLAGERTRQRTEPNLPRLVLQLGSF